MKNKLITYIALASSSLAASFHTDYASWETAALALDPSYSVIYEDFNGFSNGTSYSSPLASTAAATGVSTTLDFDVLVSGAGTLAYFTGSDWHVDAGDGSNSGIRVGASVTDKVIELDLDEAVRAVSFYGLDLFDTTNPNVDYYQLTVEILSGGSYTTVYDTGLEEQVGADGNGYIDYTTFGDYAGSGTHLYGDDSNNLGNNGGITFDGTHFGFVSDAKDIQGVRITHIIDGSGTGGENIAFDHFSFVVPEPSSAALLGLGGLALLARRKR